MLNLFIMIGTRVLVRVMRFSRHTEKFVQLWEAVANVVKLEQVGGI